MANDGFVGKCKITGSAPKGMMPVFDSKPRKF
jgi:hypothetical protein